MPWQYPIWTPIKSNKRGFAIWDLFYTRWGNITAGIGDGFFPTQAERPSAPLGNFHGIAIGSRSTVDRVMLQTQLVAALQQTPGLIPVWVDGRRIIDFQACHIGMPLRGQVLGPVTVFADETYDSSTQYLPDNNTGVLEDFVSSALEEPALHLQFLQRKQDVSLLAGPRMPMMRQRQIVGAPASGNEVLARIYPIAGRRGLTFQARVAAGDPVSFRLGVMEAKQGASTPYIENTLATVAGVTSTTPPAYIDLTGRAQWLAVYYTVTEGNTAADIDYYLTVTDDCCGEADVAIGGGS